MRRGCFDSRYFATGTEVKLLEEIVSVEFCVTLSVQAEYEVTPDEKRKECGQHLIETYLTPKVRDTYLSIAAQRRSRVVHCIGELSCSLSSSESCSLSLLQDESSKEPPT